MGHRGEARAHNELRIDGARSRPIILVERSASASSSGICTGSCCTQLTIHATSDVCKDAGIAEALAVPSTASAAPCGVLERGPTSAKRTAYDPPGTPRAPVVAPPRLVTVSTCWRRARAAGKGLHQLHGLPACRTTQHRWRGWPHHWSSSTCPRRFCWRYSCQYCPCLS
jgi:hypothetical protein